MARAAAEEVDVDGVAVRLSNPDKIYFPRLGSSGGTKRHLVEYYLAVALDGAIMTALRNRPTYLQRFPDGVEGEEIYQKRAPQKGRPDYLDTVEVTFPSGRTAQALLTTTPAQVVWGAQMGSITFHPLAVRTPDVSSPDELRIDFDPQPGTDFADARTIAIEVVKPLFDELGVVGFPKTSGGRGLHIYLRIEQRWSFMEVRRAAIALSREIERRSDDRVTTAWWKEERGERMFIDYNQNAQDRTIASAYSARRTPIATVSTPVTWDELADVEPDDFTIATVPDLLKRRGDPMASIDAAAHSLDTLLELADVDEHERGLPGLPYPPNYPKMPDEPKRVQPSRDRDLNRGNATS